MVPLSEKRHRLYSHEMPEVLLGLILRLEKRVEERTKQLLSIQSQAEIGKHASQIVHNLNSPLQVMSGGMDFLNLILSDGSPD